MSTTTGHIRAIIEADNAQAKAVFRETRREARAMREDVERQKPKIDADTRPFLDAITRARAAASVLDNSLTKTAQSAARAFTLSSAAVAAGGLVAAGAVGALPVAMAAAAALLLKNNEAVSDSFSNLAADIVDDARSMAAPLEGDLVEAAASFGSAWRDLRPEIRQMFADTSPAIRELTRGATDFARNAVPGMADAVSRSEPVFVSLRKVAGDTGQGVGDFFRNVSTDTHSTGRTLEAFGGVARTALGGTGTLVQQLATNFAPYSAQFESLLSEAITLVTRLSGSALPVLADSLGVTMDVLSGLLNILEPVSDEVGTGIGIVLSGAAAWRLYGAALDVVTRLNPVPVIARASEALSGGFATGASKAQAGATGAATAVGTLTKAMSPLGIALAATGVILGTYLLEQNAIDKNADAFVQGILKGGDAARKTMDNFRQAADQLAELKRQRDAWNATQDAIAAGADDVRGGQMNDAIYAAEEQVNRTKKAWDDYLASVGPVERAQAQLNMAIAQFGSDSETARAAGVALRQELDKQAASQKQAADATRTHSEQLAEQLGLMLQAAGANNAYEGQLLGVEQAQKNVNDAVRQHGRDSLEARQANNAYEAQLLSAVDALGRKVAAENANADAATVSRRVTEAQYGEILRLAGAAGNDAPAALRNMVAGMDAATLAAMGVTARVNEAGNAVYRLPNGKEIVLTGNNRDAVAKIQEVNDKQLHSKTLWINAVVRADSKVAADFGVGGMNSGGWVPGNGPDRDSVPTVLTPGEFVVTRKAAARWGALLESINADGGGTQKMPAPALANLPTPRMPMAASTALPVARAAAASGPAQTSGGTTVVKNFNITQNAIPGIQTMRQLEDLMHEAEVLYGG